MKSRLEVEWNNVKKYVVSHVHRVWENVRVLLNESGLSARIEDFNSKVNVPRWMSLRKIELLVVFLVAFVFMLGSVTSFIWLSPVIEKLFAQGSPKKLVFSKLPKFSVTPEHDEQYVSRKYRALVGEYLKPFAESGIWKASYMSTFYKDECEFCFLVQIKDQRIYVFDPRKLHRHSSMTHQLRMRESLFWITKAYRESPIPEAFEGLEFVVSTSDSVVSTHIPHAFRLPAADTLPRPIFTTVGCTPSANIPFPMTLGESLRDIHPRSFMYRKGVQPDEWDERILDLFREDLLSWENKVRQAVFVGNMQESYYPESLKSATDLCGTLGASALAEIAKKETEFLMAHVEGKCGSLISNGSEVQVPWFSLTDQQNFIFNIHTEEKALWSNRLPLLLFTSSCPLVTEMPCGQWFEPMLKAHEHYIPIDFQMMNLTRTIRNWRNKDSETYRIMREGQSFAKDFLRLESITLYVSNLLQEYNKLLLSHDTIIHPQAIQIYPILLDEI